MNPWNFLFPFQKHMKNFSPGMGTNEMETFMKNMFEQVSKNSANDAAAGNNIHQPAGEAENTNPLNVHVFETHHDVYVRVPVKNTESLKKLKIYHTSNTAIVEDYPHIGDKHIFTLPSIVKKKGGSANFKDGILEIRLEKAFDLQYSEINISNLN